MKKWIALLLILVMTLSTAACGASQPAATETAGTVGTEAPPTEYLPYEGETLTVLSLSGEYADAARMIAPEFEAVTGAKVEVVDYPYETLHEQALLDLTSYIGTYDVINMDSRWDGEFAVYLEPLDDYVARDKYDMSVWIENVLANCGPWQDTLIGMPTSCAPNVFAYRTDLLPDGIPDTWQEYRRVLTSVNRPYEGTYGATVCRDDAQMGSLFNCVLWSMGGSWADEEWNVTISSLETRTALGHMYAMKNLYDPAGAQWTAEESIQAFLEGKAAVCETWPNWELLQKADDSAQSEIVGKWALDVIPHDKTGSTLMSAWDTAIAAASRNKDLAWEWIKMYTSYDCQNRFYDDFGIFSPRKAFWNQKKVSNLSAVREALDTANTVWRIPASIEAEANIGPIVNAYVSSQIYQETAVSRMKTALETALENAPPEEGIRNSNH